MIVNGLSGSIGEPGRTRTSNPLISLGVSQLFVFKLFPVSSMSVYHGVWGILFSSCSQALRLHPFSETVFDGHTFRFLKVFLHLLVG